MIRMASQLSCLHLEASMYSLIFGLAGAGLVDKKILTLLQLLIPTSQKNFTVLGVSLDQDKNSWIQAIAADKLTWPHVSDLKYWSNEVAQLYRIQSIPANLLIDPTGKIIGKDLRGEDLLQKLASILK